jgi:hypothetical protein
VNEELSRPATPPVAGPNPVPDTAIAEASATKRPSERLAVKSASKPRSDWFSNQGKYIAIGFVLALVGTIYLARSNRGDGSPTVAQPTVHPGEAGRLVAQNDSKPATVVGKNRDASPVDATVGNAVETSPAQLADAAASEKQPAADLHPPTIPQLVREPGVSSQPDSSALFPWAEQPGDRLATRPAGSPAASPPAQPKYPVTPANAPLSQSYPMTSAANSGFVPLQPGPAPVPTATDYRSPYIPAPPAGQPPTSGQSFAPAGPAASPYLQSDNTARGYRYERTGSGPY